MFTTTTTRTRVKNKKEKEWMDGNGYNDIFHSLNKEWQTILSLFTF